MGLRLGDAALFEPGEPVEVAGIEASEVLLFALP